MNDSSSVLWDRMFPPAWSRAAHLGIYTIQPSRSTRSSDLVTLLRPPVQSRLRITNRSFRHTAPQLWNKLPHSLRVPYHSGSSLSSPLSSGSSPEPAVNLSHDMFHSWLKSRPISFPSIFLLSSPLPTTDYLVNESACFSSLWCYQLGKVPRLS